MKRRHPKIEAALLRGAQPCPYRWEPPKSPSIVHVGVLPERLQGLGVLIASAQENFLGALDWAIPAQLVLREELEKEGITFAPGQGVHIGKNWHLYSVPREIRKAALEAERPDLFRVFEIINGEVQRELGFAPKETQNKFIH